MRQLHAEVRREVARRELADHVKLGPGGIREIEFVAQAFQLVRGGRDPALTARPTLQVLALLARAQPAARRTRCRSSPRPTCSCATSSTACNTSTTRSATTCRRTREDRARARAHVQVFRPGASSRGSSKRTARRCRGISRRCSRNRKQEAEPWPEHPRLAALRASQRYAALPDEVAPPPRCARSRRSRARRRRRRIPRRRSRAASIWSRRSRAARPISRCSPSTRRRWSAWRASIGASSWAAEFLTRHPMLLDELLDDRVLYAPPDWRRSRGSCARSSRRTPATPSGSMDAAARDAPGAGVPPARAGPRRPADGRAARRPPVRARRSRARGHHRARLGRSCRGATATARRASPSSPTASSAARSSATPPTSTSCSSTTIAHEQAPEVYARLAQRLQQLDDHAAPRPACCSRPTSQLRPERRLGPDGVVARGASSATRSATPGCGSTRRSPARATARATPRSGAAFEAIRAEDPAPAARPGRARGREIAGMREKMHARASQPLGPVRPQARPRRHGRHRVRRAVPGARSLAAAFRPDQEPGQHRAARHGGRARPDPGRSSPRARATPTASSAACSTRCG